MGIYSCDEGLKIWQIASGITLADGIWVAAGAVVVTSFDESRIVIGGIPAKKIEKI